jgi:integrase
LSNDKAFSTSLKNSGIKDFRFHDLRHTFASQLIMAGVDLNTVRELLGHADITMTLRFSHLAPSYKQRAVDMLVGKPGFELRDTTATPDLPVEVAENLSFS